MKVRNKMWTVSTVLMFLGARLPAQAPPSFEVATVKPAPRNPGPIMTSTDPAMVRYPSITLRNLVAIAYGFSSTLVTGPDWIDMENYEVIARLPPATPQERVPLMFQTLLAERFKLAFHREAKEQSVYFLVPAKNGPRMKPTRLTDDSQVRETRVDGAPLQMLAGVLIGHGVPMATIASSLASYAGYQVIDRTQLSGRFDFELRWAPEHLGGSDPEFLAALEDQLGLKLNAGRAPVETIVIDHAERTPTEN